jgi:hypothetical protein
MLALLPTSEPQITFTSVTTGLHTLSPYPTSYYHSAISKSDTQPPDSQCHPLVQTIFYKKHSSLSAPSSTLRHSHPWSGVPTFAKNHISFHTDDVPSVGNLAMHASPNFCIAPCSTRSYSLTIACKLTVILPTLTFLEHIGQLLNPSLARYFRHLTTTQPFSNSDTQLPNSQRHVLVQTIFYYKLSSRFALSSTLLPIHPWSGVPTFAKNYISFHTDDVP